MDSALRPGQGLAVGDGEFYEGVHVESAKITPLAHPEHGGESGPAEETRHRATNGPGGPPVLESERYEQGPFEAGQKRAVGLNCPCGSTSLLAECHSSGTRARCLWSEARGPSSEWPFRARRSRLRFCDGAVSESLRQHGVDVVDAVPQAATHLGERQRAARSETLKSGLGYSEEFRGLVIGYPPKSH